jgi:hypothetical protein
VATVFLATDDLNFDTVASYLQDRLETTPETAKKIADDYLAMAVQPLKKRLDFLNFSPAKQMTLEEEKSYLSEMFLKNLVRELKDHPIISDAINHQIFYILDKDEKFDDELVRSLLANDEILTVGTVLVGGKSLRGTVGNWLRNFIEVYGSAIFDSVALSRYLIGSKLTAKLTQEEKEKITVILTIYRNLKFFPESMPDDTGDGWQILPFKKLEEENLEEAKAKIESLPQQVAVPEKSVRTVKIDEQKEREKEQQLEQLRKLAENYQRGSLGRKAVEEEINKISKK